MADNKGDQGALRSGALVLCSSFSAARVARKRCVARDHASAFGVTFTTPCAFVKSAWDVWGDARRIVGASERMALVHGLLADQDRIVSTYGAVRLIAQFIEECSGLKELDEALSTPSSNLTQAERDVLALVGRYNEALAACGLVEVGQAAAALGSKACCCGVRSVTCDDGVRIPLAVECMLASWGFDVSAPAAPAFAIPALDDDVEPGLLIAAGHTAVPALLKDELCSFVRACEEQGRAGSVAVLCAHAHEACDLHDALAVHIAESGAACSLLCRVPFSETMLGRAWKAACSLVGHDAHWLVAAADFAHSPLSGMGAHAAQALNARLRADRLSTCAQACDVLREQSPTYPLFEAMLSDDPDAALRALENVADHARSSDRLSLLERMREADAACALASLVRAVACVNTPKSRFSETVVALAESLTVPVSLQTPTDSERIVRFMTWNDAASLDPKSHDVVIVADVSEAAIVSSAARSSLDVLAEKLGIKQERSTLDEQRRLFASAMGAARERFTCVMSKRGEAQEVAYTSFAFDEYVSALAQRRAATSDHAEACLVSEGSCALPRFLADGAKRRGEQHISADLGRAFEVPREVVTLEGVTRGRLRHTRLIDAVATVREGERAVAVLSPSAIEAYLSCPYQWFVSRRIRVNELDEGFGAVEKGSFAHAVFARFYERLAARGCSRAFDDPDCWGAVEHDFACAFDEERAAQCEKEGERMVAVSAAEELEVDAMRACLLESVRRQARLPRDYSVWAHEVVIAPEDGIDYAGVRLNGRADRVDVDEQARRFVVLDYKGSLADHAAGFSEDDEIASFELPRKTQALIYAQALREKLGGYACAGALYVSYRARADAEFAAGSYDPVAYVVGSLSKKSSCVHMSFERFLDVVEDKIAVRMEALAAGDIAPQPAHKRSCAYCPVDACEWRLG